MNAQQPTHRYPRILIVVIIAAVCALLIGGYFYYQYEKEKLTSEKHNELSAIADLKAGQIISWRNERLDDGKSIQENPLIVEDIQSFLRSSNNVRTRNGIVSWLNLLKTTYHYQSAMLCDTKGNRLLSSEQKESLGISAQCAVTEAVTNKTILFSDLHKNSESSLIHLDIVIPITVLNDSKKTVIAVVLLRIDPNTYLYPLLRTWPIPSRTFETFIFRRDGDSILYLSDLRHRSNSALRFRSSLSSEHLPAAIAIRGREGSIQGNDYRTIPVLAESRKIENSQWYMIAKMDQEELFQPLQREYGIIIFSAVMLLFSFISIAGFVSRSQRAEYYRKQYQSELLRVQAEESLHESEEKFKYVFENSVFGKSITLPSGELNVNKAFCDIVGYSREELVAKKWQEISHSDDIEMTQKLIASLVSGEKKSVRFVKRYIHKNGSIVWADVGTSIRRDANGKPMYFMTSINDITEHKKAEEQIKKQFDELRRWQDVTMNREDRAQELKREVNELCRRVGESVRYPSQENTLRDSETGEKKL